MSRPAINYSRAVSGAYQVDVIDPVTGPKPPQFFTRTIGSETAYKPASVSTDRTIKPRPITAFQSYGDTQYRSPVGVLSKTLHNGVRVVETGHAVPTDGLGLDPFPSRLSDKAVTDALLKLREGTVNLGQALAEARETADLLSSTTRKIARAVRDFRLRKGKRVWDRVKRQGAHNAPSSWLELQYGWTPLMNDIVGSAIAVDEAWNKPKACFIRVSGKGEETVEINRETKIINGDPYWGWVGSEKRIAQVVLYYSLKSAFRQKINELGLQNPLEIVWEKVPFSFVVDWFIPFGDWFAGLSADVGWDFVQGKLSRYTVLDARTENATRSWTYGPTSSSWQPLSAGRQKTYQFTRSPYVSSPAPRVVLANPLRGLSMPRVTSGLSLLSQAFR